jgi:hypothetical protein
VKTEQKKSIKSVRSFILPDTAFVTSELKYYENYIYRWSRTVTGSKNVSR